MFNIINKRKMMKTDKIRKILPIILFATFFTSCDLDVVPQADIAAENFWKNEKDAWYGLNACYATMTGFNIWPEMYADNAHSHKPWEGPFELMQGDGISVETDMGYDFGTIRLVNNFLEKVENCQMDEKLRERMKAEARFFRAFDYLRLTDLFGKIPLVTETFETFDNPLVYAKSVDGLVFKNNIVKHNNEYPAFHWNSSPFFFERVVNYQIEENTFDNGFDPEKDVKSK
jgi:hypothetical protein